MTKIFIDGSEGTTGLRIFERFRNRNDIELLEIPSEQRKNSEIKKQFINESDITFLCLPDSAAIEAVSLVENPNVRIIDASTAHRTLPDWVYGFPELSMQHRESIAVGKRIAVPGCYASGFMSIVYPLVKLGIAPSDYPFACNAVSGYSGAGKKAIALYESADREKAFDAPRLYAMGQMHKHLKEMQIISGLKTKPTFQPFVCDYYSGMIVNIPLQTELLTKKTTAENVHAALADYYKNSVMVKVMPFAENGTEDGFLSANKLAGFDFMEIYVAGNEERISISSCFDNLGKGASGAAVQCMNIMLGCEETFGLSV
ncbi:MAG: N-acetyl-gamma-glutamyl-phosphate reductase [Spirochaetales bacterium]|nr:N-acetyl-gamma-glutamyl-phosphate reductase [Spirochaetales bacterium]